MGVYQLTQRERFDDLQLQASDRVAVIDTGGAAGLLRAWVTPNDTVFYRAVFSDTTLKGGVGYF